MQSTHMSTLPLRQRPNSNQFSDGAGAIGEALQYGNENSFPYIAAPDDDTSVRSLAAGTVVSVSESAVKAMKTSMSHWQIIAFGQCLALLMGLRGVSTAFLYLECNVMAPAFQLCWIYLILSFNLVLHVYYGGGGQGDHVGAAQTATQASPSSKNKILDLSLLQQEQSQPTMTAATTYYTIPGFPSMRIQTQWWKYLLLSILDMEGNYLTYLALKYTSLKSASLLDTMSIPAAMLASYMCLRKCYSGEHLTGAFICLMGAMVMVFADYSEEQYSLMQEQYNNDYYDNDNYYLGDDYYDNAAAASASGGIMTSRKVRGDILAAVGGICWGLKDTMSESILHTSNQTEFLGMLGLFGFLLSSLQVALLETSVAIDFFTGFSDSTYATCSAGQTYGMFFATIVIFVLYYMGIARFLNVSEAALLQLSLLAADLYAVLFSVIEDHKLPTWMFGLSMLLILFGVLVYESSPEEEEEVSSSEPEKRDKFERSSSYVNPSGINPDKFEIL
jgi:solute carrier family 35 protein F1/2